MPEKKKRQKVTAEITLAHLAQFAAEAGGALTTEQALAFLNQDGRAYAMWKHMMQAGEAYFKSTLRTQAPLAITNSRSNDRRRVAV
ncbi:MAG TPA: hypothetical protein VH437_20085 [Terriglobales bacterium]|jgi:hypothetical protein